MADLLKKSPFKQSKMSLCNRDLHITARYKYCLNYTSTQKNFIFFWNIYRYSTCYRIVNRFNHRSRSSSNPWPGYDASSIIPYENWNESQINYGYIPKNYERGNHEVTKNCISINEPSAQRLKVAKSWSEASYLCKSIGGFLPLIRNRGELDELITFLKLSQDMPPVEALYVGLRRNLKHQVAFYQVALALISMIFPLPILTFNVVININF